MDLSSSICDFGGGLKDSVENVESEFQVCFVFVALAVSIIHQSAFIWEIHFHLRYIEGRNISCGLYAYR